LGDCTLHTWLPYYIHSQVCIQASRAHTQAIAILLLSDARTPEVGGLCRVDSAVLATSLVPVLLYCGYASHIQKYARILRELWKCGFGGFLRGYGGGVLVRCLSLVVEGLYRAGMVEVG
jgi:hypothetical protein